MPKQVPGSEGVKDLPKVPGSLNHNKAGHKVPKLKDIGRVPDKTSPSRSATS